MELKHHEKWIEKYIGEFKDHQVILHDTFTSEDSNGNTHTLEHLVFKNPSSGLFRMDYILKGGTLFVTGDCGEAVYWWSGRHTLKWVAQCDLGYFAEKCRASQVGSDFVEWNSARALDRAKFDLKGNEELLKRFHNWKGHKALSHREEWICWLEETARGVDAATKGEYFFGQDYGYDMYNIGYVTHGRCEIHLAALKFAFDKEK